MPDNRKIVGAYIKAICETTGLSAGDVTSITLNSDRTIEVTYFVRDADGNRILSADGQGFVYSVRTGPMVWDTADLE